MFLARDHKKDRFGSLSFYQKYSPYFIFVIGLLFTSVTFFKAYQAEYHRYQQRFDYDATIRFNLVSEAFRETISHLDSLKRFIESSSDVMPEEFARFVEPYFAKPGGVSWIAWQAFHDSDIEQQGQALLIKPDDAAHRAFLLDNFSRESLQQAFRLARTSSGPRSLDISSRNTLEQAPVYMVEFPVSWGTTAPERNDLRGVILSGLSVPDIVNDVVNQQKPIGLFLELYDETSGAPRLLVKTGTRLSRTFEQKYLGFLYPPLAAYEAPFFFADKKLRIVVHASEAYFVNNFSLFFWLYFPLGILISLAVSIYVRNLVRRERQAEDRAESTAEELQHEMERLAAIFRAAPAGIGMAVDRLIKEVNLHFCEISGFSQEELIGHDARMLYFTDEEYGRVGSEMRRQIWEKGTATLEARWRRKDGRSVDVLLNWAALNPRDPSIELIVSVLDITERKRAEENVLLARNLYVKILDDAPALIWRADVNARRDWFNEGWKEFRGRTVEQEAGDGWVEGIHPDDRDRYVDLYRSACASRSAFEAEYRLRRKDGEYRWMLDYCRPFFLPDGPLGGHLGYCVDITDRKKAREELARSEQIFRSYFELPLVGIAVTAADKSWIDFNDKLCEIVGFTRQELKTMKWTDLMPFEDLEHNMPLYDKLLKGKTAGYTVERRCVRKDGKVINVLISTSSILKPDGSVDYLVSLIQDVTDRRKAEEDLARERNLLRTLIDNLPDSIYVKDIEGRKILANRADLELMGVSSPGDALGKTDEPFFPAHLVEQFARDDHSVLHLGRSVINREETVENKSGLKRWLLTSKIPLKDAVGGIIGLVGIGRDITERKSLETQLLRMAHYDTLTGLPNRTLFFEKANALLAQAKRRDKQCAILFVDLDHFKKVNDTLGHTIGDELLKDTARRLLECVRASDVLARLGGDEFVVFLNNLDEGQGANKLVDRIREKLNVPRQISGHELFSTASAGIAVYPSDGYDLEDLLKNADAAMYAAKDLGRNRVCFFNPEMNRRAVAKMDMERGLRDALKNKELSVVYQPILNLREKSIRGFEALLRWTRPAGQVSPADFIPVAEETGLIVPIGEWVLKEACLFNRSLQEVAGGTYIVSVNFSVAQLRRKEFVDEVRKVLKDSGLSPECLEIEITESMIIDAFDAAFTALTKLRDLGVSIALDDFGTGYSSLVHLQKLPINNLKIDRTFVAKISSNSEDRGLTRSMIDLAHQLGLGVTAEGVETLEQMNQLVNSQCDLFQGFLFSQPLSAEKMKAFCLDSADVMNIVKRGVPILSKDAQGKPGA